VYLKSTIFDLFGIASRKDAYAGEDADSFEVIQRNRFLFVNWIGVFVAFTTLGADLLRDSGTPAMNNVYITIIATVYHLTYLFLAHRIRNIEMLCRIWVTLCSISLFLDVTTSGGISTPWAMMFVLMPIGAGLLLGIRDVFIFTIGTALLLTIIGVRSISAAPAELHDVLLLDTLFLVVGSFMSGMSVVVLVAHYQRIDRKRQSLLLSKEYIASHDGLTGLANRSVVTEKLSALSVGTDKVNLFLADLDNFKDVNDAYGHQVGDEMLAQVAARLLDIAPESAIVARLGGDEFLLLVQADEDGNSIGFSADECPGKLIVSKLNEPFLIGQLELKMSGSVGVAHFPTDASTGEDLLLKSDLALYAAKAEGRNQCVSFVLDLEKEQDKQLILQTRLRAALDKGEIFLRYQPQFCLITNRLTGFEALARWEDEELATVSADVFVTAAEECGMIEQLGEHVLRRACQEALEWPMSEDGERPLQLSVNVSTLQLRATDIVSRVSAILQDTGFPASQLELEITESVLISNTEQVISTLNELAGMGIEIAMDDFGKGYSSLSYLQDFSLSRLKIDRSFITNLNLPNGKPIVSAIVQLAQAMELKVVAEGVENDDQRQALQDMGCHFAQGYIYAPGLSPEDALKLIIEDAARGGHKARNDARKTDVTSDNNRATG